jgi:hypothetical protein
MNRFSLIVLLLISCLSCDSINYPGKSHDNYYYVPQQLKELGNFNVGSIWIYHNDSLNLDDTVTVTNYQQWLSDFRIDSDMDFTEHIIVTMRSSFGNGTIIDEISPYGLGRSYNFQVNTDKTPTYEFGISDRFDVGDDLWDTLYNYRINGANYNKVYHLTAKTLDNEYYYVSNLGIMQKSIINQSNKITWYVKYYNIVQ